MNFAKAPSLLCALIVLAFAGCGGKTNAASEMEKAASEMAKADPAPAPTPAPVPVPSAPAPQATAAPVEQTSAAPPAQQMSQALAAYKAGNLEDAVTRLQKLRATPTLTPQQRMAMQDAVAAVMTEIYSAAAKGDARAIQAVRQYEHMQTMQR